MGHFPLNIMLISFFHGKCCETMSSAEYIVFHTPFHLLIRFDMGKAGWHLFVRLLTNVMLAGGSERLSARCT